MEIATPRPPIGTRVRVTYGGSDGYDPAVMIGLVVEHYYDGAFDIDDGAPAGLLTVFPSELGAGHITLEVL